jgi:hypothetical protein
MASGSLLFTGEKVQWRYKNQNHSLYANNVNVTDINQEKALRILNWLAGPMVIIAGLVAIVSVFLAAVIITLIGSGISFTIDTFRNGPLQPASTFNLAVLALAPVWTGYLIWFLIDNVIYKPLYVPMVVYLFLLVFLTLLSERNIKIKV